jgi:hypothetical protein
LTPVSPTWGDVEDFLRADGWRKLEGGERGGTRSKHVFYEKVLPGGRLLQTHVSHSRQKTVSAGRFGSILREQLEVSREEFWRCIQTRTPVDRPVPTDEATPEHEAWVVAVLVTDLHMTADEIGRLSPSEARRLVEELWSRPT